MGVTGVRGERPIEAWNKIAEWETEKSKPDIHRAGFSLSLSMEDGRG